MIAITTLLVAATLLCLAFNTTRLLGVIVAAILIALYPLVTAVMRFLASIAFYLPYP